MWNVDLAAIQLGLGDHVLTRERLEQDRFDEATSACAREVHLIQARLLPMVVMNLLDHMTM